MNQEKIKEQAKQIMDEFIDALEGVKDMPKDFGIERAPSMRKVKDKPSCDPEFKKRLLANAPKTKNDCIQAEKKHW